MRQDKEVVERVIVWCIVALVHLVLGAWLLRWRGGGVVPTGHGDALNVEFVLRQRTAGKPTIVAHDPMRKSPTGTAAARSPPMQRDASPVPQAYDVAKKRTADPAVAVALDLRVPETPPEANERDLLQRAPAIDVRPTRFSRSWVPAGNALEQAGFRSKAVGVALSAFGGPPRRCTEIERRLRKPYCLQLHGQEADDEALSARADR